MKMTEKKSLRDRIRAFDWKTPARWAAVCLLFTTTFPDSATAVLVIGEAWALHRQFVTDRDGALFRFPRKRPEGRPADSAAAAGTSGRTRKPKTA
jgi:hypothetical protein